MHSWRDAREWGCAAVTDGLTASITGTTRRLTAEQWRPLAEAHHRRVDPVIEDRLQRRARGEKNAVEDFLFEYYPFSTGKLRAWHPGYGVALEGDVQAYLDNPAYVRTDDGGATASLMWLNPSRQARLDMAIRILEGTASRPAATGCFALHEWAMTYRLSQDAVRHAYLPLRLSPEAIAATVEEVGLRCTHLDAFRFFTEDAVPLNASRPTRATQQENEQPGCLHASMDLYKYAFWFSPLISSDLVMDCFDVAARAREIDMRASPYDVSPFGLEPIRVETPEGRRAYAIEQTALTDVTEPMRRRLIAALTRMQSGEPDRAHADAEDAALGRHVHE